MDLKDIQELIKFVAKSGATEVDLEIDNIKISIKSPPKKRRGESTEQPVTIVQSPAIIEQTSSQEKENPPVLESAQTISKEINTTLNSEKEETINSEKNYITIRASMIGTFYRSPAPEKPPFINVGDIINEGDKLCIIEAMKLFNEIESEVTGKVIKVLVDDISPVEFDQPLFLIDPS